MPPIIGFAAPSGTGKSTAIVRLTEVLHDRGYRVGVLKHDAHRLSFDKPGKDTFRFRQAGATRAIIAGDHEVAVFSAPTAPEGDAHALIERWLHDMDLVIVEGYRHADLPCIRIHRTGAPSTDGWAPPLRVVAWFTDAPLEVSEPQLDLTDAGAQADWILDFLGLGARSGS